MVDTRTEGNMGFNVDESKWIACCIVEDMCNFQSTRAPATGVGTSGGCSWNCGSVATGHPPHPGIWARRSSFPGLAHTQPCRTRTDRALHSYPRVCVFLHAPSRPPQPQVWHQP